MLRSNSPSCSHEQTNCDCDRKLWIENAGVISDLHQGNWRALALSLILLLMHGAICIKMTGCDLTALARQIHGSCAHMHNQSLPVSYIQEGYIKPTSSNEWGTQCEALPDTNDGANGSDENVLDHTALFEWAFAPFSSVDNFVRYACHNASASVEHWIVGPCADNVTWLINFTATHVSHPYALLVSKERVLIDEHREILGIRLRVALDLSFCLVGFFLLRCVAIRIFEKNVNNLRCMIRYFAALILVMLGPLVFRGVIAVTEYHLPQIAGFFGAGNSSLGEQLAYGLSGTLMAVTIIGFSLPGSLQFGTWFWYTPTGNILFSAIDFYLGFVCLIFVAQAAYLTLFSFFQSLLFAVHLTLAPLFFACSADERTTKLCRGYFAVWMDLMLWSVLWAVQISLLRFIAISEMNCLFRVGYSSIVLQLMIFTPRIIALLELSPASHYFAMDPLRGMLSGTAHLAEISKAAYKSFTTPR